MKESRITLAALAIAAVMTCAAPFAKAGAWDRSTVLVTNVAIQIQGKVLPPGHYLLKIFDSVTDRHIVQLYDGDGTKLEMTVIGSCTYRADSVEDTTFVFDDPSNGREMPVLRAWFYPGCAEGVAFPR